MQMQNITAAHQAEREGLQAHADTLQAQIWQLQGQHQQWAWQLAALLHWKRQGARRMRQVLQSWAVITAASQSLPFSSEKPGPANAAGAFERRLSSAVSQDHMSHMTCVHDRAQVKKVDCRAVGEAESQMQRPQPMPDSWEHHNKRVLGTCFRGMH